MGREVRRVPASWQHPKGKDGRYEPLYDHSFREASAAWKEGYAKWEAGLVRSYAKGEDWKPRSESWEQGEFWEYDHPPDREYCRPDWPEESRTHLQMYETTSEGTPLSPPMPDAESLARWLADNKASAFGSMTATYEEWMAMIGHGSCVSAIMHVGAGGAEFKSGVSDCAPRPETKRGD